MFALIFTVGWKILEWSLVAAAILTYIEIGPGGDSLQAIVISFRDILLDINWTALTDQIGGHLQTLINNLWDSFTNRTIGQTNQVSTQSINECIETIEKCKNLTMEQ